MRRNLASVGIGTGPTPSVGKPRRRRATPDCLRELRSRSVHAGEDVIPHGARPASMGLLVRATVAVRRTRRYGTEQDAVGQATMNETAEPDIRATPRKKT